MNQWDMDKNVDDFQVIVDNLRKEKQQSRADAIEYLIKRVHYLENQIQEVIE